MEQGIELHISEVLKEERTKKGNSQEKLAEYCGVSKSAVSKWEQGISRPSIYQFPQIADFYNITIQRLLTGKEKDEYKDTSIRKLQNKLKWIFL